MKEFEKNFLKAFDIPKIKFYKNGSPLSGGISLGGKDD